MNVMAPVIVVVLKFAFRHFGRSYDVNDDWKIGGRSEVHWVFALAILAYGFGLWIVQAAIHTIKSASFMVQVIIAIGVIEGIVELEEAQVRQRTFVLFASAILAVIRILD